MSRSLSRSAWELCRPIPRLPPTYLLPLRARWIASTTPSSTLDAPDLSATGPILRHETTNKNSPRQEQQTSSSIHAQVNAAAAAAAARPTRTTTTTTTTPLSPPPPNTFITMKNKPPSRSPPLQPPPVPTTPIPQAVKDALPLLRAQPSHYITFHIHGRPYLVTPGDTVRLPFQMPGVSPGDVLRLNRASVLGSRDFTIKPGHLDQKKPGGTHEPAYIDERLFELRAIVVGVESEPLRTMEKTKRRNRKVKTVKSKHRYTVLRISELKIANPEDL